MGQMKDFMHINCCVKGFFSGIKILSSNCLSKIYNESPIEFKPTLFFQFFSDLILKSLELKYCKREIALTSATLSVYLSPIRLSGST